MQLIIAVGGLIAVILFSIPWLDGPLKKAGLGAPGPLGQAVLTLIVVSIFFDVRNLSDKKQASRFPRHFSDPMDVYPVLFDRAKRISRPDEKTLDVLGMSLYTAWPSVRFWLNRPELHGWTVRFTALAKNEQNLSSHVPHSWFRDARANLDSVTEYANSPTAQSNSVTIRAFCYDFMPSLHGYRLGNGDLFYSLLRWELDGHLSLDNYTYEFVPHEDMSPSAEAIRAVFDSWFQRASKTTWSGDNS